MLLIKYKVSVIQNLYAGWCGLEVDWLLQNNKKNPKPGPK